MSKHRKMLRILKRIAVFKLILGLALFFGSFATGGLNDQNLMLMVAIGIFVASGFVIIMCSFMSVLDRRDLLKSQ